MVCLMVVMLVDRMGNLRAALMALQKVDSMAQVMVEQMVALMG